MVEIIYFFFISFFIILSTLGYGFWLVKIIHLDSAKLNFGLVGLLGLFFLSIISGFTHIFTPHNNLHNLIILLLGIISLFISLNKPGIKVQKNLKYLFLIFSLIFISLIFSKTNEDFPYYHLPNSLQFAEQKLQFGLGNLNHGFKHISSIFMLMSLNYLPYFEYYLFNLTNFIFLLFFLFFGFYEIYLNQAKGKNITRILLSLMLILFLTKFSRLAEYGSDIAPQIIVATYLFLIFEILFNDNLDRAIKNTYFKFSIIFIVFAVTLKFILIIYAVFLLMVLIKMKAKFFYELFKTNFLFVISASILLFIFFNFASTGCLLYPVEKTCLSKYFEWSLSSDLVNYMNLHYETWAKGGKGPNYSVNNPDEYISNFNWLGYWLGNYFKNKVLDFILVTFVIIFIFYLFFFKEQSIKKIKNYDLKKNLLIFYILTIIVFLLWFLNFPTLRYAGYLIFYLLIIFPFIIFFDNFIDTKKNSYLKKISFIFLICYFVFLYKNFSRLSSELIIPEDQNHNFTNFPYFWIDDIEYEEKFINGIKVYSTNGMCWNIPSTCIRNVESIDIQKKNNYIFYFRK